MVGTILCTYLILLICINLKPIKNIWIAEVEEEFSSLINSKVEVDDIDIGLFNRVMVHNLVVYDQNNEILLHTKKFSAKISLIELLKGKISLRTMLLMDSNVCLYQNTAESSPNYQFIIDVFSKSEGKSQDSQFNISSLIITRANISYDKRWIPKIDGFNKDHINIRDLNANLSITVLDKNSIKLRARNFSCTESCGFNIKNINFSAETNENGLIIHKAKISLSNSEITTKGPFVVKNDSVSPIFLGEIQFNNLSIQDFKPIYPKLNQFNLTFNGTIDCLQNDNNDSQINVQLNEIDNHLNLNLSSDLLANSNYKFSIHHLNADSIFLSNLTSFIGNEQSQKIKNLKKVTLDGDANIDLKSFNSKANINIKSPTAGNINVNAKVHDKKLDLNLITKETNIKSLLESELLPEALTLTANFQALLEDSIIHPEKLNLQIHSVKNELYYNLGDINSSFDINNNYINCKINSNHPDLCVSLDGSCSYIKNKVSDIKLNTKVQQVNLEKFGVTDSILNGIWSGNLHLNIPSLSHNRLKLEFRADSIEANRPSKSFKIETCQALLDYTKDKHSKFSLYSDPITINADGIIDHTTILETLKSTFTQHIPALYPYHRVNNTNITKNHNNSMSFFVHIHDGQFIHDMLLFPLEVSNGTSIQGQLSNEKNQAYISTHIENVNFKNIELENVSLHLHSKEMGAGMLFQARKNMFNDDIQLVVGSQLNHDVLETNIEWDGLHLHKVSGSINTITNFRSDKSIVTTILPTTILLADSVWNISRGEFYIKGNKHSINNLTINTNQQHITLNGGLSQSYQDSLRVSLKNVNIGNIFEKVNFRKFIFDGDITGYANISISKGQPLLQTELNVKSFKFNNALLGDANIEANWPSFAEKINVQCDIIENNVGYTKANGYIHPSNNSIDLRVTSNKTNLSFLTHWLKHFITDINGHTSGFCRLHGTFKRLKMSGLMKVNTSLTLPANGVTYRLSDAKIIVNPESFKIDDAAISSSKGGTGSVQAMITHDNFKNFQYDLDAISDGLLLYDKTQKTNMPFYATVFANGTVKLLGGPKQLSLNVDATPTNNSLIVYTESQGIGTHNSNDGVIIFRNASNEVNDELDFPIYSKIKSPQMDMQFRFNVNMNPSATLKVIMDENTGDHLNLIGNGTLTADYYNKGTFQLYGNYNLIGGNYQMSIQDVLKRNFEIQEGSSLIFGGNPDNAQLSLKAVYTVPTASLADLNIGDNFSDRNIKANCILNIGGTASNPNVNFDLDLPNINDDEKQMVRKLITTEEDMNMQVIYLLTLGRFYTYDYSIAQNNKQSQSTVAANSFLSSTLSSQINEVISQALGSNNWTFGTNLSTGTSGWTDMGIDGVISGKLFNNRLHLNGNLGYHENQYNVMRGSNFVGDFDVKYQLTPGGGMFLKAYSQTNDKYFTKSALTTQGLGIQFQKDFSNLKDLFTRTKNRKKSTTVNTEGDLNQNSVVDRNKLH